MSTSQKEIIKKTVRALESSLERFPDNDKIVQQLALAYGQLGRFDERAVKIYNQASTKFPDDVRITQIISNAYLVTNSNEIVRDVTKIDDIDKDGLSRNIERLNRLATQYPDSPYIHRALGDLMLLRGEEREAIHHFRCALALGYTDLGSLCHQFEGVSRLRELTGYAGVFFAEMYQRLGAFQKAHRLFLNYMSGTNPEKVVLDKYAEFLERRIEDIQDRSDIEYQDALRELTRIAYVRGNFPEALTWARQLTPAQIGENSRLAKDLARRLMMMEDFRLAFDYMMSIPLDDEAKSLLNEMTVHLEKRGELDAAVYILQYINANDEIGRDTYSGEDEYEDHPDAQQVSQDLLIEIETELQMAELNWKNRRWDLAFERYLRVLELGYEEYGSLLEPLDILIPRLSDLRFD